MKQGGAPTFLSEPEHLDALGTENSRENRGFVRLGGAQRRIVPRGRAVVSGKGHAMQQAPREARWLRPFR